MRQKVERAERKEAERRALSEEDIRRIDEANLDAMRSLFRRYGGHKRYVVPEGRVDEQPIKANSPSGGAPH